MTTSSVDPGLPPPQDDTGMEVPPATQSRTDPGLPPPQGEPETGPGMGSGLPPPQSDLGMGPGPDAGIKQQDSMEVAGSTPSQSEVASYETPTAVVGDQFTPAPVPQQSGGVPADQSQTVVAESNLTATDVALAHVIPPGVAPPPYEPAPSAPPPMVVPTMTGAVMAAPPMVHPSTLQQVPVSYHQMMSQTGHHPLPPAQMTPPGMQVQIHYC